jgi:PKHD-type hydroxylase
MYKSLCNNTFERNRVTYQTCWWDNAFNDDELNKLINLCDDSLLERAGTIGEQNADQTRLIRRSKVKFIERDCASSWIFDRFNDVGAKLNEQFYGFNLYGYDSFQYTVYEGTDQGEYNWHMDMELGGSTMELTRKMTMVLLLSEQGKDFLGGDFEVTMGNQNTPDRVDTRKGRIVAFPSFLLHRVKPITMGVRKSIVIWITGPKFI